MANIELRFHKDMLVLSAPVAFALERQGVNIQEDGELVMLMEPETVQDALRMECDDRRSVPGCRHRRDLRGPPCSQSHGRPRHEIALRALEGAWACKPQRLICEIGSCGLPLDPSSESSRAQTEQQYENAVQALNGASQELDLGMYDAVLLNALRSVADAECAINAARRKTDRPVFASVDLDEDGLFAGKETSKTLSLRLIGPMW